MLGLAEGRNNGVSVTVLIYLALNLCSGLQLLFCPMVEFETRSSSIIFFYFNEIKTPNGEFHGYRNLELPENDSTYRDDNQIF